MSYLYEIALTLIKGIGPIKAKYLIATYESAENIFKQTVKISSSYRNNILSDKKIKDEALAKADKEIEFTIKNDVKIHYYLDQNYPYRLRECEDAPVILYQKGSTDLNKGKFLAVVGTRNITPYGKEQTNSLIEKIAVNNPELCIVSGLAYGVDGTAHRVAIREKLSTVAVLAHGLDMIYPAQHKSLYANILLNRGSVITEYPSKSIIEPSNFVQRNRIIAGISDAVLVIESAQKGGALLTAKAANTYNRDVFAFPGRVDDVYSQGCNNLIKANQAHIVTGADDICFIMGWEQQQAKIQQPSLFIDLSEEEQKVVEILRQNSIGANELSRMTAIPIQKLISMLILLEFKGIVKVLPGNLYKV